MKTDRLRNEDSYLGINTIDGAILLVLPFNVAHLDSNGNWDGRYGTGFYQDLVRSIEKTGKLYLFPEVKDYRVPQQEAIVIPKEDITELFSLPALSQTKGVVELTPPTSSSIKRKKVVLEKLVEQKSHE